MSVYYRICPKTQATCSDPICLKDQTPDVCPKEAPAPLAGQPASLLNWSRTAFYVAQSCTQRFTYKLKSLDGTYCHICGGRIFTDAAGISHHGAPTDISCDDDADHAAIAEHEPEDE